MSEIIFQNLFTIILTAICIITSWYLSYCIDKNYNKFKSRQLLSYKPTVWTSIGILGTFISIVYSLWTLNGDFKDVQLLISNISPAFITSIIGVTGSIYNSYKIKAIYAKEEFTEVDEYKKFLNNPSSFSGIKITPEMQLYSIYNGINQLVSLLRKDGDIQKQMAKLSQNISGELNQTRDSIEQISSATNALFQKILADNGNKLSLLIKETSSDIKESIVTSSDRSSKDLGNDGPLATKLADLDNNITKLSEHIAADLSNNGAIAKNVYSNTESVTAKLENQNEKIKDFLDKLIENISEYYKGVSQQTADATVNLVEKNFVDYKQIFSAYNEELKSLLENYNEVIKEREANFVAEQDKVLNEILTRNSDCMNASTELIKKMNSEFALSKENVNELIKLITSNISVAKENENALKSLTDFIEVNDKAMDTFNSCMNNVQDKINRLREANDKFEETVADSIDSLGNKLGSKIENLIEDSSNNLQDAIEFNNAKVQDTINKVSGMYETRNNEEKKLLEDLRKLI